MNFDFDNIDEYLAPRVTEDMQKKIASLNVLIDASKITAREAKFIDDVKRRILANKTVTEKQKLWLAKIIKKCDEKK